MGGGSAGLGGGLAACWHDRGRGGRRAAAAHSLGVRVRVWEGFHRGGGMWVTFGADAAPHTIHMRNQTNVHFELLVPLERSGAPARAPR